MRGSPTASEERLWLLVLSGNKLGVAFNRQVCLGPFIVDFLAPAEKVIVEVDGPYHARRSPADARRDRALARAGYRIVRVPAELVHHDVAAAAGLVARALER